MTPALMAGIVCATLYLIGVFVAGLHTGNTIAWQLALATMGVCAAAYATQLADWRYVPSFLVAMTWLLGAGAGLSLVWR